MKKIYFSFIMLFVCISMARSGDVKEQVDFGDIKNFYGEWRVVETQRYQGTLESDEEFKEDMAKPFIINAKYFQGFGIKINSPAYKYYKIKNDTEEGVLDMEHWDTSYIWDFRPEREFTHQYKMMKGDEIGGSLEVLTKDQILIMYAGRLIILERVEKKGGAGAILNSIKTKLSDFYKSIFKKKTSK